MEKLDDIKKALMAFSDFIYEYDMAYWCAGLRKEAMEEIENMHFQKYPFDTPPVYRDITPEEKKTLLKMVEAATERFRKRLNVYLKRYGLSKINSWSYLSD